MAGVILYSANPWFAVDLATRYRGNMFFAWVSEYFDAKSAPPGSAAALVAPSSTPCRIYRTLLEDATAQDDHSALIGGYRKKFALLARQWLSAGLLSKDQHDEIIASVRGRTWTIWRPVLYVIPRQVVESTGRLTPVPRRMRGGYGPELQVSDLHRDEFDIVELAIL